MGGGTWASRLLDIVDIDRPLGLVAASVALVVALYALGIALSASSVISSKYWNVFPAAFAILYALSIYGRSARDEPSHRPLRIYLTTMLLAYLTLLAIAAPPGYYVALASPSTVNGFLKEVESFRSTYTTLPSMSTAIFEHNLEIDLISYVPVAGAALLGFSIMETSSLVWAASSSSMMAGNPLWFSYVLSVIIAPDTFTEFSSYAIAVVGGYVLYTSLIKGDARGIWRSAALLAGSIALLYASAVLEAWLILNVGA